MGPETGSRRGVAPLPKGIGGGGAVWRTVPGPQPLRQRLPAHRPLPTGKQGARVRAQAQDRAGWGGGLPPLLEPPLLQGVSARGAAEGAPESGHPRLGSAWALRFDSGMTGPRQPSYLSGDFSLLRTVFFAYENKSECQGKENLS